MVLMTWYDNSVVDCPDPLSETVKVRHKSTWRTSRPPVRRVISERRRQPRISHNNKLHCKRSGIACTCAKIFPCSISGWYARIFPEHATPLADFRSWDGGRPSMMSVGNQQFTLCWQLVVVDVFNYCFPQMEERTFFFAVSRIIHWGTDNMLASVAVRRAGNCNIAPELEHHTQT